MAKLKLRRGFKKEAEEYAEEFRTELGLLPTDPLDPKKLAALLEIPVLELSTHPTIPDHIKEYFANEGSDKFSAATLIDGTYKEILHNDYHHPNRQNSSIMHEISHIILGHPPKPPLIEDSCRNFDPTLENEANNLGFTLLVPKKSALNAIENFASKQLAADFYGVSLELLQYRIRISDAIRWAKNRAKYRGASIETRSGV